MYNNKNTKLKNNIPNTHNKPTNKPKNPHKAAVDKLWPIGYSSQPPVFVNKIPLAYQAHLLNIVYGCFHATMAELSSFNRGCMAHKA